MGGVLGKDTLLSPDDFTMISVNTLKMKITATESRDSVRKKDVQMAFRKLRFRILFRLLRRISLSNFLCNCVCEIFPESSRVVSEWLRLASTFALSHLLRIVSMFPSFT